ncbi:MAG: NTP transferase domain-containing protein, partial [Bacteroidetes bacterium]|nr:NTP transferase domain-containing protein [Bacteroidota bacterium]
MRIFGVIPARYGSSRFPGKPLAMIHGKSMIQRVYEQAQEASELSGLVVATDDERIAQAVRDFGGEVVMTQSTHQSGTDRCQEAVVKLGKSVGAVVNIQGDEPFIQAEQINQVATLLKQGAPIATLVKPISSTSTLLDPNKVKAILNKK